MSTIVRHASWLASSLVPTCTSARTTAVGTLSVAPATDLTTRSRPPRSSSDSVHGTNSPPPPSSGTRHSPRCSPLGEQNGESCTSAWLPTRPSVEEVVMFYIPCGIMGCDEIVEEQEYCSFSMCDKHGDEMVTAMWEDVPIISFTEVVEDDGTITMYPAI